MVTPQGAPGAPAERGGLFDGFEGYRTPSDDEFRSALVASLVVFDTNVFLNLYRYNDQTRRSVIDVIAALGDRFWVPYQVLEEFWRNRERALVRPLTEVKQSAENLGKQLEAAREVLRMWVNRAALTPESAQPVEHQLAEAFDAARALIDRLADSEAVNRARNTQHDSVLASLLPVLEQHVGRPMSEEDYARAVTEGQRRAATGEPPGFADVSKADSGGEGAAGDYLVWEQVLNEAEHRHLDVVFVTGDVKRDWWRYEDSFPRGPRIELSRELGRRCGARLFMILPETLLRFADVLAVTVEQQSVEDVERTSRSSRGPSEGRTGGGWTTAVLDALLAKLATTAPVQEATIRMAAQQGGYIGREDVYLLGEYEPERQLKGFTRPVNRLVQELRDAGDLPEDAVDLLSPVYDKMVHGLGWVDGFRVPAEIVRILAET